MSLHDLFDHLGCRDVDPQVAADKIAADLKLSARQREYLAPLVLQWCANMERGRVRQIERSTAITHRAGKVADRTAERQSLMAETFTLGDGRRIAWGTATVAQHEERITFLARYRNGITATIDRHTQAISAIRAAGVTCLAEIAVAA